MRCMTPEDRERQHFNSVLKNISFIVGCGLPFTVIAGDMGPLQLISSISSAFFVSTVIWLVGIEPYLESDAAVKEFRKAGMVLSCVFALSALIAAACAI